MPSNEMSSESPPPQAAKDVASQPGSAVRLALLGFLTLFLELALIRYLGGNVWNLSYFPNLVLLAVFVGMGMGFVFHHHFSRGLSRWLFIASPMLLTLILTFVYFYRPMVPGFNQWASDVGGELFFTALPKAVVEQPIIPSAVSFLVLVIVFALISQRTAKLFSRFRPLTAYTLDISGSCAGIVAFMLVSYLELPAYLWFVLPAALFVAVLPKGGLSRWIPLLPGALCIFIAHQQDQVLLKDPGFTEPFTSIWSPYQKVEYVNVPADPYRIYANGVDHQVMVPPGQLKRLFYQEPHNSRKKAGLPPYRDVLVLGAGTGNDVASALLNDAQRVDAVEIDPVIARLGREEHPARPYSDKRVNLVIDDGRAFMTNTPRRYDLIIFALTDSLVKVSSMAQLRLENYLFTKDSLARAYELLQPGGEIVLYNFYRKPWVVKKILAMAHLASGQLVHIIYRDKDLFVIQVRKPLKAQSGEVKRNLAAASFEVPTDDWPFLYLKERGFPAIYAKALMVMSCLVGLLVLLLHLSDRRRPEYGGRRMLFTKLSFVFMGVAFLLLETKSIIQFSLLFGTTWVNSSLVFLGVLILVLAANWTAQSIRGKSLLPLLFGLLILSSLITLIYPLSNLLVVESTVVRFFFASLMTFSPIFFANLIFSMSFRDQPVAEHIFGWNLIGAMLGGILEYTSMAMGYNMLAFIVAVTYILAGAMLYLAHKAEPSAA